MYRFIGHIVRRSVYVRAINNIRCQIFQNLNLHSDVHINTVYEFLNSFIWKDTSHSLLLNVNTREFQTALRRVCPTFI